MFWNISFENKNIINDDIDIIDNITLKLFLCDVDCITFNLQNNKWTYIHSIGSDLSSCETNLNYIKKIKNKLLKNKINCLITLNVL